MALDPSYDFTTHYEIFNNIEHYINEFIKYSVIDLEHFQSIYNFGTF